jgi:hypothetical protein
MKKTVIYEACNGTQFQTEEECLKYDLLNLSLGHIMKICAEYNEGCENCPLFSSKKHCAFMELITKEQDFPPCNWTL